MTKETVVSLFDESRPNYRLREDEVTIQNIRSVLDTALLEYISSDDEDIYVKDGADFPFWISIINEQHLVRFFTHWPINDATPDDVNLLNDTYTVAQFAIHKDRIMANYYLPFRFELDSRHLIISARRFGSICRSAWRDVGNGKPEKAEKPIRLM